MSATTTTFDLSRLTAAIETHESAPQVELYSRDATVTIIDRLSPPGSPRLLRNRDQIAAWIEDTCSRELTHKVQNVVRDENSAAFLVACQYPDGTRVACATVLELTGGLITAQTVVQAWDER